MGRGGVVRGVAKSYSALEDTALSLSIFSRYPHGYLAAIRLQPKLNHQIGQACLYLFNRFKG